MKTASFLSAGIGGAFLLLLASAAQAQPGTIGPGRYRFNPLAGASGSKGYVDGTGTAARFDRPGGIAVDLAGNVYVSEQEQGTIRKISTAGVVTTLAGAPGELGSEDGAGSAARFRSPVGVAVDRAGNVYVADAGNHTIRKVSAVGGVTTLAGSAGVAGSRDGAGTEAQFTQPTHVAVDDAGNLFVTETHPHRRIRKLSSDGTVSTLNLVLPEEYAGSIEVWAGDLRVDRAGNLYVIYLDGWDFIDVVKFKPRAGGDYEPGQVLVPPTPLSRWERVDCIALDEADNLYVKYGIEPICRFAPTGEAEVRYAFGSSGGYLLTGLAADARGRLFTLPYSYAEKVGVIEVATYDPAAAGLSIIQQPFDNSADIRSPSRMDFGVRAVGAPALTFQWFFNSNPIPGATQAYLTLMDVQASNAGSYSVVVTDRLGGATVTSRRAQLKILAAPSPPSAASSSPPVFVLAATPRTVIGGQSIALNAPVSNTPDVALQWSRNGQPIAGATGATLTLTNVQSSDAGTYQVVAAHSGGNTTHVSIVLDVIVAPAITRHPAGTTVASGSTAVFSVTCTGATTYQWRRNGQPIFSATNAMLVIPNASAANIGSYSVALSNAAGTTTSIAALLMVLDESNFGHLTNFSVRTPITADAPTFTIGALIGGETPGTKPLLVRAVGPSLAALGIATPIADVKLEIRPVGVSAGNNDWGGDDAVRRTAAAVGAFPLPDDNSKDAALIASVSAPRACFIDVSGVGGATGEVLAELYDASAEFSASTPRLTIVEVLKRLDVAESLTAGFVIRGSTARTFLVRAIGPGLWTGLPGPSLPDPQLALFNGAQTRIAENDNWNGDRQLRDAGVRVGATEVTAHTNAMLLITLPPGAYTAQVSGKTGSGFVLVEVYEVP